MNIASFNVRGLNDEKMQDLVKDVEAYKIDILAVQETHLKGEGIISLKSNGNKEYNLIYSGNKNKCYHGIGFLVEKELKCNYEYITERIGVLFVEQKNNERVVIINVYAPTLERSKKIPKETEDLYERIDSLLTMHNRKKNITILLGDFNAKTGSAWKEYPRNMGKYGKGLCNENGRSLLEVLYKNNMVITNTLFNHKMSHRSTWTSPDPPEDRGRKNPYRNQIDYIIVSNLYRNMVVNSRSYGGAETVSDHKIIKMSLNRNLKWKMPKAKDPNREPDIDIAKLRDSIIKEKYQEKIIEHYSKPDQEKSENPINIWNNIKNICIESGKEVLGKKDKKEIRTDADIQQLSQKQKNLWKSINNSKCNDERQKIRVQRKKVLKELHEKVNEKKEQEICKDLEEIENMKNDSTRFFKVIKEFGKGKNNSSKLVVRNDENKVVVNIKEKTEKIKEFFEKKFNIENEDTIEERTPMKMRIPFTKEEIEKVARSLKNGKSPGIDCIRPELLKNAPPIIYEELAKCFNRIAETGTYHEDLITSILIPLQKPGKEKGPLKNLRPINLLTSFRKIMAISIVTRIIERLEKCIPKTQAAYQSGRSTTEHVHAIKMMVERIIASKEESITIILLDMTAAFDTVKRKILFNDLKEIIEEDELNILAILLREIKIKIKCEGEISDDFTSNIGVPQGDCLSAVLFILYLAFALKSDFKPGMPRFYEEHNYPKQYTIHIDLQYADDISFMHDQSINTKVLVKSVKKSLEERNLEVNETKTEIVKVKRKEEDDLNNLKFLGSYIDTKTDIEKRGIQAWIVFRKKMKILKSRKISMNIRMRLFNCYVGSVYLYNSELWVLTKEIENKINVLQRKFLKISLNIFWPKKISNKELYDKTKQESWTTQIKRRRLNWLGHMLRLNEETPLKKVMAECEKEIARPPGRRRTTWKDTINKDLEPIGLGFGSEELKKKAENRKIWKGTVGSIMSMVDE